MSDPVYDLLKTHNIDFTPSGQDYVIKCLNPEHEDTNPSCRVDKVTGITHCLSCNWSANIFKHFGIFTNFTSIKVAKLKAKLKDISTQINGLDLPDGAVPYNRPFRGISGSTFKHFSAFYTNQDKDLEDRIVFPITDITGKTVVFHARHTLSDAGAKYLNKPAHVALPLFPSKLDKYTTSIILVEGIFDMLNLFDKGLRNVVCTFGTSTLRKNADKKLLPYRVQGVTKIYLMFDGDKAGKVAAKELKTILEEFDYSVEIIELEDNTDPGGLSQEYVDQIKEYIK